MSSRPAPTLTATIRFGPPLVPLPLPPLAYQLALGLYFFRHHRREFLQGWQQPRPAATPPPRR